MSRKYKIMIVEDQTMPRQLFELFIKSSDRYEVAISIDNAEFADVYCLKNPVDLILMDVVTKNGANGLVAAEKIKKAHPEIKIIIVTSMPECSYIDKAKAIGVDSFWYKEISEQPIMEIIDRTIAGEKIFPETTPKMKFGFATSHDFTDRELSVLREMTGGFTNPEIGEHLNMSVSTVKTHIQSMLDKTGFRNRTELAVKARESGIVILD